MAYNMPVRAEKYAEVARVLAPSAPATGTAAIDAVLRLRSDIGIDRSISSLGGTEELFAVLVEDATADRVNLTNPRPVDPTALEALYRAAW
jgi:alcohol dehydrogenase class IV